MYQHETKTKKPPSDRMSAAGSCEFVILYLGFGGPGAL